MDRPKNKKKGRMNKHDDCSFCGGRVSVKYVRKVCWWGDNLMAIIDNVPAGVCGQCGERYYNAKVLKEIEMMLKKNEFDSTVHVPFADFADA